MKISLLREREDFDAIFINSLSKYLKNRYQWSGTLGFKLIPKSKEFIVNDLLNVFYPESMSREHLWALTQEFSWHPSPIKTLLQKVYIFLAVRFPLEKFLSSSRFYITDERGDLDGVVIIPGNHSIRLVDTYKNICTVICKDGFDKKLLIKDAQVRLDNSNLNVPKIIELNNQEGWYQEDRVIGLPLNRLDNELVKEQLLIKCQNDLKKLYSQSLLKIDMSLFVKNIVEDINGLAEQIKPSLEFNIKKKLLAIIGLITNKITLSNDNDFSVCDSHGDFQPANILCSDEDFWIIDWEYSKQRSIFYDALVYELEFRLSDDLSTRLTAFFIKIQSGNEFFSWTGRCLDKNNIQYFYVFILEDLLLKLQELSSVAIINKNNKLNPYLIEIQLFLSSLNK